MATRKRSDGGSPAKPPAIAPLLGPTLAAPVAQPPDVASIKDLAELKRVQVNALLDAMNADAWRYLPIAHLIGKQKAIDLGEASPTTAAEDNAAIAQALNENRQFLETSLRPDIEVEMSIAQTPDEVVAVLEKFSDRAGMYGDYVWQVYQRGFKDSLDGEMLLEFFGPADARSCPTCLMRVAGNPYPASRAPVPGQGCECRTNCRHDLVPHGAIPWPDSH